MFEGSNYNGVEQEVRKFRVNFSKALDKELGDFLGDDWIITRVPLSDESKTIFNSLKNLKFPKQEQIS